MSGDRVYLRSPRGEDQQAYLELRRVSAEFLLPWEPLPPADRDPLGPEAFQLVLKTAVTERRRGLLIVRRADEALLGAVNLSEIVRGAFHSCYLGYWIGAPFARQGYMTEALGQALDFAFDELGLHRVEANIIPRNRASIRLVEKLGFRREGYSPRYLCIAGVWEDHERWAMTAEDRA